MKKWMKILLSVFCILLITVAGAFLYIDHKVTQAMVDMMKKQDALTQQVEASESLSKLTENSATYADESKKNVQSSEVEPSYDQTETADSEISTETIIVENESIPESSVSVETTSSVKNTISKVKSETTSEGEKAESDPPQSVQHDSVKSETYADEESESNDQASMKVDSESSVETSSESDQADSIDTVSIQEKAKAYELAFSKLTQQQVDRLFEMSAGGFTAEEKKEAKKMFYANFTPEEQAWILEMYRKYY